MSDSITTRETFKPSVQTMASELRQSPGHLDVEFGSCSGHTFDDPVDEVIISTNSVDDGGSE